MNVAGYFLKASTCRIVTLSGMRERHTRMAPKFHKLELSASPSQSEVETFVSAVKAHCSDNNIDMLVVNTRQSTGIHAGGSATFRIEGILLASSPVPVKLVHSATIRATERKHSAQKTERPTTKDLGTAYDLAFQELG